MPPSEAGAVRERYARRAADDLRYSLFHPVALQAWQERLRALLGMLSRHGWHDVSRCRLLEVGSGGGGNLLDLLRLGFEPSNLAGIELLPHRHQAARRKLPDALPLTLGDACEVLPAQPAGHWDIVFQSTVFSSLLDDGAQQQLADAMWRAVRPGGAVLWYDFTVNNPRNADVRGVPVRRVRALFPQARVLDCRALTLAPPLARGLARWHPALCAWVNWPWLRTHRLCWLAK